MADKTISIEELLALAQAGAKITTEKREHILARIQEAEAGPVVIQHFEQLIKKIDEMAKTNALMAKANEALAVAETERAKAQLEVLATLQALIRSGNVTKSHKLDLTPLKTVLTEIQKSTSQPVTVHAREPAAYDFIFERSRQGFIEKVTATPILARRH